MIKTKRNVKVFLSREESFKLVQLLGVLYLKPKQDVCFLVSMISRINDAVKKLNEFNFKGKIKK